MGPFTNYLQECGIVAQYTISGIPQRNGVAKRRNRTLMNTINTCLTRILQGEALKTTPYITEFLANLSKIPFELWTDSLNHLRIWGCPAEATIYNLQRKKTYVRSPSYILQVIQTDEMVTDSITPTKIPKVLIQFTPSSLKIMISVRV